MASPVIIAISGWKQSGKDTSAAYLIDTYGVMRVGFADPLKDKVAADFNIDRAALDDPSRKEQPLLHLPVNPQDKFSKMIAFFMVKEFRTASGERKEEGFNDENGFLGYNSFNDPLEQLYWTPRALCILEGSSKRSADSNYWVKQAVEKTKSGGFYVISDLRYKSEVEALKQFAKENGATILTVRVNRFDNSPSSDPSERDLDDYAFDTVIDNKTSRDDLHSKLDSIMTTNFFHLRGGFG